ncbi:Flagellar export protein FliJ [Candidatus Filomicrobium marinum]|uniref:Flagellar export protein FliJ n=2 Tax=Filomicrobium TaxID=119044 RepID=A0A0D6JHC9_9HYPH|nr:MULTISPECIES: hypothetical protein [Filomicrobium]MCV0369767.1 flagellar export protein FliJ [Filomicrobium sp.]CFX49924.1 Flagellar export protein FliJ [Candidatus Filomicrobium marinum]CPR20283.1 Flagellar export protein FliJ [Candidatus Filomicrobium marinum]SDP12773.1 hypothetical protein SAMN04488061_2266 [Filomicrobium insigne]
MKSRDAALRLKRFEADEKARKVVDLQHMIAEFERMAGDLDRQIRAEEERTGVKDTAHYAYSTFAKSASLRRDNLNSSANELRIKLESAQRERDEAMEQLTRVSSGESQVGLREPQRPERHSGMAAR